MKPCRKRSLGKPEAPDNLLEEIQLHRFTPLHISHEHAELAGKLPILDKDPFDRMLTAQAITKKVTLVTRNEHINRYDVALLTA